KCMVRLAIISPSTPEIGNVAFPLLVNHHVIGLDIPMNHPLSMRVVQGGGHFANDLHGLPYGEFSVGSQDGLERASSDVLVGDVVDVIDRPEFINGDDVGMAKLSRRACLAQESNSIRISNNQAHLG